MVRPQRNIRTPGRYANFVGVYRPRRNLHTPPMHVRRITPMRTMTPRNRRELVNYVVHRLRQVNQLRLRNGRAPVGPFAIGGFLAERYNASDAFINRFIRENARALGAGLWIDQSTRIQAAFRGWRTRADLVDALRSGAATRIQAAFRGYDARNGVADYRAELALDHNQDSPMSLASVGPLPTSNSPSMSSPVPMSGLQLTSGTNAIVPRARYSVWSPDVEAQFRRFRNGQLNLSLNGAFNPYHSSPSTGSSWSSPYSGPQGNLDAFLEYRPRGIPRVLSYSPERAVFTGFPEIPTPSPTGRSVNFLGLPPPTPEPLPGTPEVHHSPRGGLVSRNAPSPRPFIVNPYLRRRVFPDAELGLDRPSERVKYVAKQSKPSVRMYFPVNKGPRIATKHWKINFSTRYIGLDDLHGNSLFPNLSWDVKQRHRRVREAKGKGGKSEVALFVLDYLLPQSHWFWRLRRAPTDRQLFFLMQYVAKTFKDTAGPKVICFAITEALDWLGFIGVGKLEFGETEEKLARFLKYNRTHSR